MDVKTAYEQWLHDFAADADTIADLKAIANNEVMDEAEELSTEAAAEVEEETAPSSEPQNDDSSSS